MMYRRKGLRFRWYVLHELTLIQPKLMIEKVNLRYMVDTATYKEMHDSDEDPIMSELSDEQLQSDEPPDGDFVLLLPHTIRGYGFHNKKWSKFDSSSLYLVLT